MPDDVVTMGFYNLETYDNYAYQTVNGITFGYLSYTEHTNGLPTPSGAEYGVVYLDDHETIAKQIADMRDVYKRQVWYWLWSSSCFVM